MSESQNPQYVYLNGEQVPLAQASVPITDHAYLYGDGLFEGVRVYENRVFELEPHLRRLFDGARTLKFQMGDLPLESVTRATLDLCRKNNHSDGYIRITLSRGTGLGLDPAHMDTAPRLVIFTSQLRLHSSELAEQGLTMVTCATRVPNADAINPRIKGTGKYINNIQAKLEANRMGAGEGMMLNSLGHVAEATGENLFLVVGDEVVTPPTSAGCLKGITRAVAMRLSDTLGLRVREANITPFDVHAADECFLTGTAAEIVGVASLDGEAIGRGRVGDTTRHLQDAFRALTKTSGAPL